MLRGALLGLALAGLPPSVQPWPIGAGLRYHPTAVSRAVRAGRPIGGYRCGAAAPRTAVHVELFANRRVVVVPAGIGAGPGCLYPLRTAEPTGVVLVSVGGASLGGLFRIWGRQLGPQRLLSFRSPSGVSVYVNGRLRRGDPNLVPLTPHAQIVVEIDGQVPPHPSYLFPRGTP